MITHLEREIKKLKDQILELSAEVEDSIRNSYKALADLDLSLAHKVIDYDKKIDEHEVEFEEDCLKIMALYQPVAKDLRMVIGLLKMNNDLERIGDLAANIAEYTLEIAKYGRIDLSQKLSTMFEETQKMVKMSLDSLVNLDSPLAVRVCENDDIVDRLNSEVIGEIKDQIKESPDRIDPFLFLISVSRTIERMGDYATNIAEDVLYMTQGEIVRHHIIGRDKE